MRETASVKKALPGESSCPRRWPPCPAILSLHLFSPRGGGDMQNMAHQVCPLVKRPPSVKWTSRRNSGKVKAQDPGRSLQPELVVRMVVGQGATKAAELGQVRREGDQPQSPAGARGCLRFQGQGWERTARESLVAGQPCAHRPEPGRTIHVPGLKDMTRACHQAASQCPQPRRKSGDAQ